MVRLSVLLGVVLASTAIAQPRGAPSLTADPLPSAEPGAPPAEPVICGNGKVDSRPERVCASCIPGHACPCGWTTTPAEQCDGQDFAGATCNTFGFDEGELRCDAHCKRELSGCTRKPPPPPPAWLGKVIRTGGPKGSRLVAAVNGNVLLVAGTYGAELNARVFDARTLSSNAGVQTGHLPPPENYANVTLIDVFAALLADGFVIAVLRYTEPRTYLFRVTAAGKLEGPFAQVDARPIFLAGGKDRALLGTTEGFVLLGADGRPTGKVRPLFKLPTWGEAIHAHATAMNDGWVVAIAVRKGAESTARLGLARVTSKGEARVAEPSTVISDAYDPLALATDGSRAFVAYDTEDHGFAIAEVAQDLSLRGAQKLAGTFFIRVLGAAFDGKRLTAWASNGGRGLHRLRVELPAGAAEDLELIDALPRAESAAAAVGPGFGDLVFRAEETSDALLYRDDG